METTFWDSPDTREQVYETTITSVNLLAEPQASYKLPSHWEVHLTAFKDWMLQLRYSDNTINTYVACMEIFIGATKARTPQDITKRTVEWFNQHYILKNNLATTTQNQYINAVKLFMSYCEHPLQQIEDIERPRKEKRLPEVLSQEEIKRLLEVVNNTKHKAMLSLIYSAGLRAGELIGMKLTDLNSSRMMIHIHRSKGKKDRYVPLSPKVLDLLRDYYKKYRPKKYLFEGPSGGPYTRSSLAKVLKRACRDAGIKRQVTIHTLRHSYATHLLEKGVDIRYIQEILGHNSPRTTMIYTHVSREKITQVRSPFDDL